MFRNAIFYHSRHWDRIVHRTSAIQQRFSLLAINLKKNFERFCFIILFLLFDDRLIKKRSQYCGNILRDMKPTVVADEMFPEGAGPFMELDEVNFFSVKLFE